MKSSNPIFKNNAFNDTVAAASAPMTVSGTMNKLLILSVAMLASAGAVYYQFSLGHYDYVNMLMIAGAVIGLILALIISFKPVSSPYLAPVYAFSQGAVISGLSCIFEKLYEGIVMQAIAMTFFVVFSMFLAYKTGILRATETFKKVILLATLSIAVFYLFSFILSFFGVHASYFTSNSPLAIAVNVAIAIIAALNLIIDFDFIEKGANSMLPSVYEWYGAFGLLVTILWLYVEILRLLSKLRSR